MAQDLILTFFSPTPPIGSFSVAPLVVAVPPEGGKGSSGAFAAAVNAYRDADGRALPNLLSALAPGLEVGRVAVLSFSAGRAGAEALITSPADRAAIDTMIDLDGLHFGRSGTEIQVERWAGFGESADGQGDAHLLVNWHTAIVPGNHGAIYSTTESNRILYEVLAEHNTGPGQAIERGAFSLAKSESIENQYGSRVWDAWPTMSEDRAGNSWRFGVDEGEGASHLFAARFAGPAIVRALLAPRWNAGVGTSYDGSKGSGALPGDGSTPTQDGPEESPADEEPSLLARVLVVGTLGALGAVGARYLWRWWSSRR